MIYVVGDQRGMNVARLFKTHNLMGYEWTNRLEHINFWDGDRYLDLGRHCGILWPDHQELALAGCQIMLEQMQKDKETDRETMRTP